MKIKKSDLESLTQSSAECVAIGILALAASSCPLSDFYQALEELAKKADALRVELGLTEIFPALLKNGKLSEAIAEAKGLLEVKKFDLSKLQYDPKKVN